MLKSKKFTLKRLMWYGIGFVLFYAPFALIERCFSLIIHIQGNQDIHGICLRCGLLGITGGIKMDIMSLRMIFTLLLIASAFLMGPVFCRLFCVAGAITEYMSRVLPDKMKINWQKYINPVPVKYGILTGYLLSPFMGLSVACSYCHYSLVQRTVTGLRSMDIGVLSSTNILTMFVWLILLGVLTKGGRGFCSYLCPVGAIQSLAYSIGRRLSFTCKLKLKHENCTGCGQCVKKCPMGAIRNTQEGMMLNAHNCITCKQCINTCQHGAITYGAIVKNETNNFKTYEINSKGKENEIP